MVSHLCLRECSQPVLPSAVGTCGYRPLQLSSQRIPTPMSSKKGYNVFAPYNYVTVHSLVVVFSADTLRGTQPWPPALHTPLPVSRPS